MFLPYRKRVFTLVEVIVASIILASVFGGLFASYIYVIEQGRRTNGRLGAVQLARGVLNNLYNEVRADTWDNSTSPLYAPTTSWYEHNLTEAGFSSNSITIDSITYIGNYTVRKVSGKDYREVKVNIQYPL